MEVLKKVVDLLVGAGADLLRRDRSGRTVFETAARQKDQGRKLSMVLEHLSGETGEAGLTERHETALTDALAVVINQPDSRDTVEMLVTKAGVKVVERLIEKYPHRIAEAQNLWEERRRWMRCWLLERLQLSRDARIFFMEKLYFNVQAANEILHETLKRFEKEIRGAFSWESGCVDCDFLLQCDRALYGFPRQTEDEFSLVPSLCRPYSYGPELESRREDFSRLTLKCRSEQLMRFASLEDVFAALDKVIQSEEEWWDLKSSQEIFSDIDPTIKGDGCEEAKAVSAAVAAQAQKIKDTHVATVYWKQDGQASPLSTFPTHPPH
uniref:Uncharacterized protein n=1 Tax=Chromera velia CCMP2878 TaxID=1169474 RepID=A0A0G4IC91_9ALVE|eukprot:Cvel_13057.t1-p1 / transcript=Cvel_13057.t1 / gene=Cvel_13057 / organism=Chromera_velia_CCMP2878 / gene_product=hypothetical protein / transcript_product=hypothetical protein / location=Cvel_scaffold878:54474-56946(+) / protein_length=323 / sequence_SO=supercontig / SO=protein_coding / is_pseudo=false